MQPFGTFSLRDMSELRFYRCQILICIAFFRTIARAIIESDQWPVALRGKYKRRRKYTTAFRELIAKMPGIMFLEIDYQLSLFHYLFC